MTVGTRLFMEDESLEVVFNFWFLIDEGVGFVYALLGRAYAMTGSDEEKLRTLHSLANGDHLLAKKFRVPERYVVVDPAGNKRKCLVDPRLVMDEQNAPALFEQVIQELEKELPPRVTWINGEMTSERLAVSDSPLMVCTGLLEHKDGSITRLAKPYVPSNATELSDPLTVQSARERSEKVVLRERTSPDGNDISRLTAYVDEKGCLVLEGYDLGNFVEEVWGDSDYEYWRKVKPEFLETVLLQLIKDRFSSDGDFHSWLREKGIPDEFDSWA